MENFASLLFGQIWEAGQARVYALSFKALRELRAQDLTARTSSALGCVIMSVRMTRLCGTLRLCP